MSSFENAVETMGANAATVLNNLLLKSNWSKDDEKRASHARLAVMATAFAKKASAESRRITVSIQPSLGSESEVPQLEAPKGNTPEVDTGVVEAQRYLAEQNRRVYGEDLYRR